jgi:hypothetical protein
MAHFLVCGVDVGLRHRLADFDARLQKSRRVTSGFEPTAIDC